MALLQNLSSEEKQLLTRFLDQDTKDLRLSAFDGTALGLVKQGVLFISTDYPDYQTVFNIENWAWELLKKHPKLLHDPTANLRKEREKKLQNLSREEKHLLRQYIQEDTKVLFLHTGNGTANGLVKQGILTVSSSFTIGLNDNFHIVDWAWDILKQNPNLLN